MMNSKCLDAIWQVTLHIGQMQGILAAEATNQGIYEAPPGVSGLPPHLTVPVALPTNEDVGNLFDIYSEHLNVGLSYIGQDCMDVVPDIGSVKQLTANGLAEDFQNPFAGETQHFDFLRKDEGLGIGMQERPPTPRPGGKATDAYQLWKQLKTVEDAIMDWVNEIFLPRPGEGRLSPTATTGASRR